MRSLTRSPRWGLLEAKKTAAAGLLFTAPVLGQTYVYDAGDAGNPPVAPDPLSAGWLLDPGDGSVALLPVSPDASAGINAWEVADNSSTANGRAVYFAEFAANTDWTYTLEMRQTAGPDFSIFFEFAWSDLLGDCMWGLDFAIVGADVVARDRIDGTTFACSGGADGGYHSFVMRGDRVSAEFVYDGVVQGGLACGLPAPGLNAGARWGASSGPGLGRARFHRVAFEPVAGDIGGALCSTQAVPNSTGVAGELTAYGIPSAGGFPLTLTASELPPNQFGYFLASLDTGVVFPPGSQGALCLSGNIGRFSQPGQIRFSGPGGTFALDVDTLDIPINPPRAILPGERWYFQCWHRDVNPMPTSNFTTGRAILFQ